MSKAILVFKLPEENEEFTITKNAFKYLSVLDDLEDCLRSVTKYNDTSSLDIFRTKKDPPVCNNTVFIIRKLLNQLKKDALDE